MSSQPDHSEAIRKLLALKRYEQPPPRYFQEFSGQVLAKLQAEAVQAATPWWERLGWEFLFKPSFLSALGVIVCGGLAVAMIDLEDSPSTPVGGVTVGVPSEMVAAAGHPRLEHAPLPMVAHVPSVPDEAPLSSVQPVLSSASAGSPFNQFTIRAQRVGFNTGFGGN